MNFSMLLCSCSNIMLHYMANCSASSRKRIVAKRPGTENNKITASEKKRTKKGMNDAVRRALEQCK